MAEPRPHVESGANPSDRLEVLDLLRGIAVSGMVLAHFFDWSISTTRVENLLVTLVALLVRHKALTLFAILFGASCAIQLENWEKAGTASLVMRYVRRMVAVALFGAIAKVGIGYNVLFGYAEWGLLLLLVRRWSVRSLALLLIVWCYLVVASHQLESSWLSRLRTMFLPSNTFTMLLVGFTGYRVSVLRNPGRHLRLIYAAIIYGIFCFLMAHVLFPSSVAQGSSGLGQPSAALPFIRERWFALTYIGAALLLVVYAPGVMTRARPLMIIGRLALTNYVMQIVVIELLLSRHFLGLPMRPYYAVPATILMLTLMSVAGRWWLTRYRWGPLEWILRTATYARWQPIARHDRQRNHAQLSKHVD